MAHDTTVGVGLSRAKQMMVRGVFIAATAKAAGAPAETETDSHRC